MHFIKILLRFCRRAKDNEILALELLESQHRAERYKADAEYWRHQVIQSQADLLESYQSLVRGHGA